MKFYPLQFQDGTAVPALAWSIASKLMDTHIRLPKLTIVSLVRDAWKLEKPDTCGLLLCKQFVEWMAETRGYNFYSYGE